LAIISRRKPSLAGFCPNLPPGSRAGQSEYEAWTASLQSIAYLNQRVVGMHSYHALD